MEVIKGRERKEEGRNDWKGGWYGMGWEKERIERKGRRMDK